MRLDDTPLPIPMDGNIPSLDDTMQSLRAFYAEAISEVVDRVLNQLILPDHQAAVCADVAQFTTFLMAVKIADVRQLPPTAENLMRWYWPLQKALKDEVPGMIRQHAAAVAAQGGAT